MKYEVEQKHHVTDVGRLQAALDVLGAVWRKPVRQVDLYFNHPARDFAQTDEALRIRRIREAVYVTYKGPKIDTTTKTRRELELFVGHGDQVNDQLSELLSALSFRPVAEVRKTRTSFTIHHGEFEVEGALDEVAGLGTFAELELTASDDGLDAARTAISQVATYLPLGQNERRSYLELILAAK
jgi:adenylate cyclase class 2